VDAAVIQMTIDKKMPDLFMIPLWLNVDC